MFSCVGYIGFKQEFIYFSCHLALEIKHVHVLQNIRMAKNFVITREVLYNPQT